MDTSKLTALTAIAAPGEDDILYVVDDPAGTAVSYKVTLTNLRKSLDRVYDVKNYGAVGNGSTDDTTAIQAAITAAETDKGTVFFPPGTYKIAGTLLMNAGTDVTFTGQGATLQQFTTGTTTLSISGVSRVVVNGLRFVGLGTETPWAAAVAWNSVAAIHVAGSSDVIISNNIITNHAGGSIRHTGTCNRLSIVGNIITGMGSGSITTGQNGYDFAIGGLGTTCNGLLIDHNHLAGHAFGIYAGYGDAAVISNNIIKDIPGQHAMYLQPGQRMAIVGNSIYNCANGGIKIGLDEAADFVRSVTISGNNIENVDTMGIVVVVQGDGVPYDIANVSIVGNNILDAQYGIYLYGTTNVNVVGNRIRTCTYYGITLRAGSGYFKDNVVKECKGAGFYSFEPRGDITLSGFDCIDSPYNPDSLTGASYTPFMRCIYLNDADDSTVNTVFLDGIRCFFEDQVAKTGTGALAYCVHSLDYNRVVVGTLINDTGARHEFAGPGISPFHQPAQAVIADDDAALTTLNLQKKILTMASTAPRAPVLPTGTDINAIIGFSDAFDWTFINTGSQTVTITGNTGHTTLGNVAIAATSQKTFRTRCSTTNTAVTYALS